MIYITKWALTQGILKREATITDLSQLKKGEYVYAQVEKIYGIFYIGKDAFLTLEEAIIEAEDMRRRKIASLRKQIEKIEGVKIKIK